MPPTSHPTTFLGRTLQAVKPIWQKVWNACQKAGNNNKCDAPLEKSYLVIHDSTSTEASASDPSSKPSSKSTAPSSPPTIRLVNDSDSNKENEKIILECDTPEDTSNDNYWEAVDKIPDSAYVDLIIRTLQLDATAAKHMTITGKSSGGFNLITFLRYLNITLAIKVPAAGWAGRWTSERAFLMRSEVETMKLIHLKTEGEFPIPEILDYNDTLQNELGAPYIIMERLPGKPALEVWYDWQNYNGNWLYDVDSCPLEKVQLRENFLKSLAEKMSLLDGIESSKIGMLTVDLRGNLKIDQHTFVDYQTQAVSRRLVYDSAKQFYMDRLSDMIPKEIDCPKIRGACKILETIFSSPPFASSPDEEESFVLTHSDLNCQNILCDPETGEVTGIIDWEGASFLPRCVGFASLPLFLREDWVPEYSIIEEGGGLCNQLPIHELRHYRSVYTKAFKHAMGGTGDCQFTSKSMIYNAVHTSLFEDHNVYNGDFQDVVMKILWEVLPYEYYERVCETLGKGWTFGDRVVLPAIQNFMKPEEVS